MNRQITPSSICISSQYHYIRLKGHLSLKVLTKARLDFLTSVLLKYQAFWVRYSAVSLG
jgi:hypothetical protein